MVIALYQPYQPWWHQQPWYSGTFTQLQNVAQDQGRNLLGGLTNALTGPQ